MIHKTRGSADSTGSSAGCLSLESISNRLGSEDQTTSLADGPEAEGWGGVLPSLHPLLSSPNLHSFISGLINDVVTNFTLSVSILI